MESSRFDSVRCPGGGLEKLGVGVVQVGVDRKRLGR